MRHAEERSHSLFFHSCFIEHVYAQTKLVGDFPRALCHVGWSHVRAGFVGEVAGKVDRFADDSAALDAGLQRCLISAVKYDYELLDFPFFFIYGSVLVRIKQRHQSSLDYRRTGSVSTTLESGSNGDRPHILPAQFAHRGSTHLRRLRRGVLAPFADANQQQSLRLELGVSNQMKENSFAFFSLQFFRINYGFDRPASD